MTGVAPAVALSLASALCYAVAAVLQQRSADASPGGPRHLLRARGWWISVALNCAGAALHVLALALGSLSVVQPLGALTIVFALLAAAVFLRRPVGRRGWHGTLTAAAGLAGLLAFADASGARALTLGERRAVAGMTIAVLAVLILGARFRRETRVGAVLLAAAAGVSFAMASVFTKAAAGDWARGEPMADWVNLPVTLSLSVGGLLLAQSSYRGAGLAAPLATLTVVNPVAAMAVGIAVSGESFRHGTAGTMAAIACGCVAALGLSALARERGGAPRDAGHLGGESRARPVAPASAGSTPARDSSGAARTPCVIAGERAPAAPADCADPTLRPAAA